MISTPALVGAPSGTALTVSANIARAATASIGSNNSRPGPTKPAYYITDWADSRGAADYLDSAQLNRGALSPLNWANDQSGANYLIGQNFSVAGDRTDQGLARVAAVAAAPMGTVRIYFGVNNFAQTGGAYTYIHAVSGAVIDSGQVVAQTFADVKQGTEAFLAGGAQVTIELEVGANNFDATQAQNVRLYNALIVAYANATPNVYYHDMRSIVLVDPDVALPQFKPKYSEDGVHLNARGSYRPGKSLKTKLAQIIPAPYFTVPARDAVTLPAAGRMQLASNPIFAVGSGGVGSTVSAPGTTTTAGSATVAVTLAAGLPTGVPVTGAGIPANTTIVSRPANGGPGDYVLSNAATASATITMVGTTVAAGSVVPANCTAVTSGGATVAVSVVADATGIGNNVILTPNFLATNDVVRLVSDIAIGNWSPGDIVEAYAEIEVMGAINLKAVQLELSISGTNASGVQVGQPTQDMNNGSSTVGPDEDYILFERTRVIQVSAAMTTKAFMSVGLRGIAAQAAAAGATSIRIRRLVVNRYTALPY
ncbi:hypothetical protein U1707_14265 [Sphingomonas sp. PB2P12]|uniref:hypothetical protein n=1 Tax=Sphingomonas sandaracina TaxID=3096157 RepID=UPI002FCA647C